MCSHFETKSTIDRLVTHGALAAFSLLIAKSKVQRSIAGMAESIEDVCFSRSGFCVPPGVVCFSRFLCFCVPLHPSPQSWVPSKTYCIQQNATTSIIYIYTHKCYAYICICTFCQVFFIDIVSKQKGSVAPILFGLHSSDEEAARLRAPCTMTSVWARHKWVSL